MYLPTTPIVTSYFGVRRRRTISSQMFCFRRRILQAQEVEHELVHALLLQRERQLVDRMLDVAALDDGLRRHVAEHRELAAQVAVERMVRAAHEHVRLDADLAELGDGLLRRLGLQFAGGVEVRHERDVDEHDVLGPDLERELPHRLEERQALDVAGRAADLGDEDVAVLPARVDAFLDLVRDVRDHLHGLAEVIAAPLLRDDVLVDLAGREAVESRKFPTREALVVPEVEVRLGAVLQHVHLAVLERAHRARIDVEVRVELLDADDEAAHFQQRAQRRRGQALAQRGNHASRDKNVFHGATG